MSSDDNNAIIEQPDSTDESLDSLEEEVNLIFISHS